MAKGKPLRRKTRLAFALVPALLVGVELLTGADPPLGDATAASDVSSGLQSLSESVGGFAGVHVDVGADARPDRGNVYYVCPSTYGDYISTRAIAPGLITFLQNLSQGDGAFNTATTGTSGFRETAIVFPTDVKFNTNPIHPDTPGHFTCGP